MVRATLLERTMWGPPARVTANICAADRDRARTFYADTLGLQPVDKVGGEVLRYGTAGGTTFHVYRTDFAGTAGHTIAQWHVADIEAEVRAPQAEGVTFETYDMPDVEWDDGIATMAGLGRAAWFRDSEGNILCLDQDLRTS